MCLALVTARKRSRHYYESYISSSSILHFHHLHFSRQQAGGGHASGDAVSGCDGCRGGVPQGMVATESVATESICLFWHSSMAAKRERDRIFYYPRTLSVYRVLQASLEVVPCK